MDRIFLKGLRVETVTGVHAWEQQLPRVLIFDLELATDTRRAAARDDLQDALDYSAVAQYVTARVPALRFRLLESLAEELARLLMVEFRLSWLRLTVHKPGAVPGVDDVAIGIERRREDYAG